MATVSSVKSKLRRKIPKSLLPFAISVSHCIEPVILFVKNSAMYNFRYKYGYDANHFLVGDAPEVLSFTKKLIRPGDMGAALSYAFGIDNYQDVQKIFGIKDDPTFLPDNTDCVEQINTLLKYKKRTPKLVLDIGCGRGEVSATLAYCKIKCVAIDPSSGSRDIINDTYMKYYGLSNPEFINDTALAAVQKVSDFDTVIFCESMEHISTKEFFDAFVIIKKTLTKTKGLMIISNFIDFHPIKRNPNMDWNHITTVDDKLYDELAKQAKSVVFRKGSHLVLQF